jgi:hypothetical protein
VTGMLFINLRVSGDMPTGVVKLEIGFWTSVRDDHFGDVNVISE